MKHYEKPFLTVARFTTQETIASAYTGTPTVEEEPVEIGGATVTVPVTTYNITSLGANSNS